MRASHCLGHRRRRGCCLIGKALNAVVVRQNYSRLVIDCNGTPGSGTSVLDLSELTRVPGNIGLSERHKLARVRSRPRRQRTVFGDNEPYSVTDASDYTIPVHGEQRTCTMWHSKFAKTFTDEAGQRKLAALFVRLLRQAYERLTSLQIPKSN
jgi:predicted N-formylglutamate amidohydrolase